jgi:aspartate/methionine/tyrosine aminotransferase
VGRPDNMKITKRAEQINPFYVMELLEKAKALEARGENIVHMEVGEPDFPTPRAVKRGGMRAIREDRTFYTHSLGLPELRDKIAAHYRDKEGVDVSPDRIVITNGTSGAFLLICAALLDRTKILAISDPGYPCYRNFALLVDARIMSIPVSPATRFQITEEHLRAVGRRPDMLIISHPSNPTGTIYDEENIERLHALLSRNRGLLIVDEIYSGLCYGKRVKTALAISDEVAVVNGFSKTYAMTGWRLGWMVVPQWLVRTVQKIAQNVFISPPSISQYAALSAFDVGRELETMRRAYESRKNFMLPELRKLGFTIPVDPEGAFYIYAGIERWGLDSMMFVERALAEANVALTPGYDFGSFEAGSHIRFSYANNLKRLKEGCARLARWLDTF